MNEEYKQLLILKVALDNFDYYEIDLTSSMIRDCFLPLKGWVDARINEIEDKIDVVNRLQGK